MTLHQEAIGILSDYGEGKREPSLVWIPERVPNRVHILCRLLHRASPLQYGRGAMFLLDILGETVQHSRNRLEIRPCQ